VHPGWRLLISDMGLSPSNVLSLADLPADLFSRKDAWLTPAEYFRLWHGLEAAGGSANIPLAVGRAISVEAFDPAIFASLCSPNLNVALLRIVEYKRLIGPLTAEVLVGSTYTELTFRCYGHDRPLPRSLAAAEMVFFTQLARLATRSRVEPIRCELVMLASQEQDCESFLGCRLQLGVSNLIRFSAKDARRPFLTENIAMWEFFEPSLRARLSKLDVNATLRERVRGVLLEMLPSGQTSIDEVARRLGISRRSLQRSLEKDEAHFRDLLNDVRCDLAFHYLNQSDLAPGEIAYLLGFEDPNSFLRAFKSWTGKTPGEFRAMSLAKETRPGIPERGSQTIRA
jgi:AraC-like DNA-binding protein